MNAFWRIFLTIVSVLFFTWIALNIDGFAGWLACLQFGVSATILIYLVSDRIQRDIAKEKKKDKDENKKEE